MKQAIPATTDVSTIGRTIERYYDEWAVKFTHKRRIKPPKYCEEDWNLLFDELNVRVSEEREILKALFTDYVPLRKGKKMFDYNLTLK